MQEKRKIPSEDKIKKLRGREIGVDMAGRSFF